MDEKEYIEREKVIKDVSWWYRKALHQANMSSYNEGERAAYQTALSEIVNSPAADVRPVVRGRWIESKKHLWERNEYGEIDIFRWNRDYHNGPICEKCGYSPCVHCTPNYDENECYKPHYVCSICGRVEINKEPFCNCGADMRGEL